MERKLDANQSEKTGWAVGILLEFSSMLLNGDLNFTDETFKLVAEAELYLTKHFTSAQQIELFIQAATLKGVN